MEVHLPPPALLELLEIKGISKTRPRAAFAPVELASAQAAQALAAYLEDALLRIPGHMAHESAASDLDRRPGATTPRRSVPYETFFGMLLSVASRHGPDCRLVLPTA